MRWLVGGTGGFVAIVTWLAGIVLAKGWMKLVAIFAPYAWYLVVEYLMKMYGLIQ